MIKHTSGPWSVGIAPRVLVVWGDSTMPRTVVARIPNVGYPERAQQDARLIAAAPDLLEALKWLLHDVGRDSSLPGAVKARAAIAKATVEQS